MPLVIAPLNTDLKIVKILVEDRENLDENKTIVNYVKKLEQKEEIINKLNYIFEKFQKKDVLIQ